MKRLLIFFLIGFSIVGVDQSSKESIMRFFGEFIALSDKYPYGGIGVFDSQWLSVSFQCVINRGAAWGFFSDFPAALLFVRLLILAFICRILYQQRFHQIRFTALTIVFFAAISNVIDMVARGGVVDMIKVVIIGYHYPIFNIADSLICLAVMLLLYDSLTKENSKAWST